MDDLGALATIWVFSAIAATVVADRAGKGVLGFLLGLVLGPIGFLIALYVSGGYKVFPDQDD